MPPVTPRSDIETRPSSARRQRAAAVASLLLGVVAAAPLAAQPVVIDVRQAAFPAVSPTGCVARSGQWTPIVVSLRANTSDPLDVFLETECLDIDGDRVRFIEGPLVVTPGVERLAWLYAAGGTDGVLRINVLSQDGAVISRVDAPLFDLLPDNALLILDISQPQWTALQVLESQGAAAGEFGTRTHSRGVAVSRMPAANLPDRWWGLEAAQVIAWDTPDPGSLGQSQLTALIDWVRCGGQLIVGLGDAWPRIRGTALGAILPVSGDAPTEQVATLPFFLQRYGSVDVRRFERPINIAILRDAGATRMMTDQLPGGRPTPLLVTHPVGGGRVTVCATSLRDLTGAIPQLRREALLAQMLDVWRLDPAFVQRETEQAYLMQTYERDLYSRVVRPIEFQQLGSLLLVLAMLFVAGYIAISTLASWAWLHRKNLRHLSWTVFAGFAAAASLLSLGTVQLTRGWQNVQTISLLDVEAGAAAARGAVFFGYRSSGRQRDNLRLESEPNAPAAYLRGLARGPMEPSRFKTPDRYTARPKRGLLEDVLMRATLKQFEGYWAGSLDGTIRGQLVAGRDDGRLRPESYLVHDLGFDLAGGYLLYIDPRLRDDVGGDVPLRASTLNRPYRPLYRTVNAVPPAAGVLAISLGVLPPDTRADRLGEREYRALDEATERWLARTEPDDRNRPEPPTLWDVQVTHWAPGVVGTTGLLALDAIEADIAAALLLSTRNLYQHNAARGGFDSIGHPLNAVGLVDRDVSHWLARGQAVALLWARQPGPAQLVRDGSPLKNRGGLTLYRVRLPITYVGAPPARSESPGSESPESEIR